MKVKFDVLSKSYGHEWALRNVDVMFSPGKIIAVTGENGAGKTTMLQLLAGILSPDKGQLLFDGTPFVRANLEVRKRTYFMPDTPAIPHDVSIVEYAGIVLKAYGKLLSPERTEWLIDAWTKLNVIDQVEYSPAYMSRGQLYKAAIPIIDVLEPDLYILDEPFASGMDAPGIAYMEAQCRRLARAGSTIVFTTQLLSFAERLADQACVIQKGRVTYFGDVNKAPSDPRAEPPDSP